MKIDNFALTMHQACPAKFDLSINQGWQPRRKSGALGFGAAFHEGMAQWYKTGDPNLARQAIEDSWQEGPIDDYRTKQRCIQTFDEYIKVYPSESFVPVPGPDGPFIEVPFAIDTGTCLSHCQVCGFDGNEYGIHVCVRCKSPLEPIEYGGIFDGLVEFNGSVYILEHKTTSMLGPTYFYQFKPNNQVTGYVWGASQLSGMRVGGAIINAICVTKTGKAKFERHLTTRQPEDIARWLRDVWTSCNEIDHHKRTGHWPMRTPSCMQYGMCAFHGVHVLPSEREQLMRLEQDYVKQVWDFESRDEPATTP